MDTETYERTCVLMFWAEQELRHEIKDNELADRLLNAWSDFTLEYGESYRPSYDLTDSVEWERFENQCARWARRMVASTPVFPTFNDK